MSTAGYLQDAKNQQKRLAETITSKGITATATEKYKDLVDKVAQIENLKGEERTLENFTNVLSEPKSVVQLEYPEPKNLFDKTTLTASPNVVDLTQTTNGFTFKTTATSKTMNAGTDVYLPAGTYYCSGTVTCSDTTYKGGWAVYDNENKAFIINKSDKGTIDDGFTITESKTYQLNFYAPYNAPVGVIMTFENVQLEKGTTATPYEPYPAPKTLNAKLGSKNLIPYPYVNTTSTMFGVTFTVNSDGSVTVNGTATANAVFDLEYDATMFTLPAGNYFLSGCPSGGSPTSYFMAAVNGAGAAYDKFLRDSGSGISVPSKGEKWKVSIRIMSGYTADNLVFKPQLELSSTATSYTPYISDFSTVNVTRCGKNLIPLADSGIYYKGTVVGGNPLIYNSSLVISNFNNIDASSYNGVYAVIKLTEGETYTLTINNLVNNCETKQIRLAVGFRSSESTVFGTSEKDNATVSTNYNLSSFTFTVPSGYPYCLVGFYNYPTVSGDTVSFDSMQLELGTTATNYEPYQGQTYTPTTTGEVTGITNLYPTTTLLTDNAGVVFEQVTGGTYKEILPSTDKNGITKVYQPSVDSTIDSNITSDNIKQGVSILGVIGDYICNYTYDETTKELVLIL